MSRISDDQVKNNVASNLRRAMVKAGVSQNALARALDESPTRINQYAMGRIMPGAGVLARICDYLGVSVDAVLYTPGRSRPATGLPKKVR